MISTITRRMNTVLDDLQREFKSICTITDVEAKMYSVKAAGSKSDRASKLRKLFDLLDVCGISYEKGRDNQYYENLIKSAHFPDFSEIEKRMIMALYSRYKEYPDPEEYMLRIVNRLCFNEDLWMHDSLRLRILKQFMKYGNYLSDAGYGGRKAITDYAKTNAGKKTLSGDAVLLFVDDGIFSCLENATKAQKKPDGKYGLLKLSDDLATGKFRAEGSTKKGLYLFAMAFGMTYFSGRVNSGEILDYRTDIEINLFRDYYSNNLMRFISEAYRGRLCEYEVDPSGQGINYKNFAEMIYVYFISQSIEPNEKIRLSSEMIKRVQSRQFKAGNAVLKSEKNTVYYKGLVFGNMPDSLFCEDVLKLPAEEFEDFICEHYDCDTYAGTYETKNGPVDNKISEMQLQTEQNTAYLEYQRIIKKLQDLDVPLDRCNYGLWFTDVAAFKKLGCSSIKDRLKNINDKDFNLFVELLQGVNDFVGYTVEEETSDLTTEQEWKEPAITKTKALFVPSANEVTRTSIIVAFYYYYNALHENDGNAQWKNFEELFKDFKREVDLYLLNANYQALSGKNIFDILVTFSSYAYLNI